MNFLATYNSYHSFYYLSCFGFSTGKFKENNFEARSVLSLDSLCRGFTPAVITFSGECGPDSTVNFATDSGITGTVTGNIACV